MPLIVTPRHLSLRAELYYQLGSLLSAGITLHQGLETLRNNPPSYAFRKPVTRLLEELNKGATFSDALLTVSGWVPSFDIALLRTGEESGRLDICFKLLAEYYRERAKLAREVLSSMIYPTVLVHMVALIFPVSLLSRLVWQGEMWPFLLAKMAVLGPIYGVTIFLLYAGQSGRGERWREMIETFCDYVPVLGTARRAIALARLSVALEALINAGVSIINGWDMAAEASGSIRLRRTVAGWRPLMERGGRTPSSLVSESRAFPEVFTTMYHTGEISGKLDETLERMHYYYQDEGLRKLKLFCKMVGWVAYGGAALAAIYQIFSFYMGYFNTLNSI